FYCLFSLAFTAWEASGSKS
ncbi:hypothetical protein D046_2876B, partial [Vibrio parahaemolyticus V-223/04]